MFSGTIIPGRRALDPTYDSGIQQNKSHMRPRRDRGKLLYQQPLQPHNTRQDDNCHEIVDTHNPNGSVRTKGS